MDTPCFVRRDRLIRTKRRRASKPQYQRYVGGVRTRYTTPDGKEISLAVIIRTVARGVAEQANQRGEPRGSSPAFCKPEVTAEEVRQTRPEPRSLLGAERTDSPPRQSNSDSVRTR